MKPVAVVARMIGRGEIRATGLRPPELVAGPLFDRLVAELAALGFRFRGDSA